MAVANCGEQLVLALGIEIDKSDFGSWFDWEAAEELVDQGARVRSGRRQIFRPAATAFRNIDPTQEAWNHLTKFEQHQVGVVASLGQRVSAHPKE